MMRLNRFSVRRNADAVQRNTYVAVLPMSNPASLNADSGVRAFDDVGEPNENLARAVAAKHYHYQSVLAQNAGHVDLCHQAPEPPQALEIRLAGLSRPNPRSRWEEFELRGGVSARTPVTLTGPGWGLPSASGP